MSLEFPIAQGWSKGLDFVFEDRDSSAKLGLSDALFCKQVHGKELYQVTPSDMAKVGQPLAEADGLWGQGDWLKELSPRLLVRTADCAPILMVDRLNQSVAAIHAGWRGVLQGIHRVPLQELSHAFTPKNTWVWVGPCLNGDSFEVGPDMYDLFPKAVRDNPKYFVAKPGSDRRFFQVWDYLADDFAAQGVDLVYNVETDTLTNQEYASYRRAQKASVPVGQQNFSWLRFSPTNP